MSSAKFPPDFPCKLLRWPDPPSTRRWIRIPPLSRCANFGVTDDPGPQVTPAAKAGQAEKNDTFVIGHGDWDFCLTITWVS